MVLRAVVNFFSEHIYSKVGNHDRNQKEKVVLLVDHLKEPEYLNLVVQEYFSNFLQRRSSIH